MDPETLEQRPQPWQNQREDDEESVGEPLSRQKSSVGGYGERKGNAVDIDQAMESYEEMRRELTRQSTIHATPGETEKGQEGFDLTDYLSGIDKRQASEGFQPKHLGLVVKNLTVKVMLLTDNKIHNYFLTPFDTKLKPVFFNLNRAKVPMQSGFLLLPLHFKRCSAFGTGSATRVTIVLFSTTLPAFAVLARCSWFLVAQVPVVLPCFE